MISSCPASQCRAELVHSPIQNNSPIPPPRSSPTLTLVTQTQSPCKLCLEEHHASGYHQGYHQRSRVPSPPPMLWTCKVCSADNQQNTPGCRACGSPRCMHLPPIYDKSASVQSDFYGDFTQLNAFPHRATRPQQMFYYQHVLDATNDLPSDLNGIIAEFAASEVDVGAVYRVLDEEKKVWREAEVVDFVESEHVPQETVVHFRYLDAEGEADEHADQYLDLHSYRVAPLSEKGSDQSPSDGMRLLFTSKDVMSFSPRQRAEYCAVRKCRQTKNKLSSAEAEEAQ